MVRLGNRTYRVWGVVKLTLMVQLGNRTYKGCSHILDWTIHINVCDKERPKIEN